MYKRKKSSKAYPSRRRRSTFKPYKKSISRFSGRTGELKFFDTALSFTFDATSEVPSTGQLALIPQGVTESTRVGRKCTIKSIQLRGVTNFAPSTDATASSVCYMYLVQDTQTNGAAAAVTDVISTSDLKDGFINLANSSRFRILKRFVLDFDASAGVSTAYNNVRKPLDYYKKCNIPLEFSSTTGAISELKVNNIFLLAGSSGSDDKVTMSGNCRLRFSDN